MDVETIVGLVKFLSIGLYTDLMDSDKQILGTSTAEILKKSPEAQLASLEKLLQTLTFSVKKIQVSEIFPKFSENEQYQRALQKLDSQVRNHIKEELQLKLFSDDLAGQLSLNSHLDKSQEKIQDLVKTKENLVNLIRIKEIELETDQLELRLLKENEEKEMEKVRKMQTKVGKIKSRWLKGKGQMESLRKEFEKDKEEFEWLKSHAEGTSEIRNTKLMGWDMEVNKSCRVTRAKSKKKIEISPIKVSCGGVKAVRLSQSTKGIRNPQRARTLKDATEKLSTRTRLKMYTIKK